MNCVKNNISTIVKLILNHCVSGIYSLMLLIIFYAIGDGKYLAVGSFISIFFYLFLVYSLMWGAGAKDAASFYKKDIKPTDGILLMVFGTLPSIITNLLACILYFFKTDVEFPEKISDMIYPILYYVNYLFVQCMYSGIFVVLSKSAADISPFLFLLSILPAILVGGAAYMFGFKSFRLRTLFGIKFDEEKEKIKRNY